MSPRLQPDGVTDQTPQHFLDLAPLGRPLCRKILEAALARKAQRAGLRKGAPDPDRPLAGAALAMLFEKKSTRTRASFEAAIRQLGGSASVYSAADLQLDRGESIEDTARVLSRFFDAVMLRAHAHESLLRLAAASDVPVINGLTDKSHPCQILADLLTLQEAFGRIDGLKLAWIGDGNNVCASLIEAAASWDFELRIAAPPAYAPAAETIAEARAEGARIALSDDPRAAAAGADAVFTDTWVSMGDEDEEARKAAFARFQIDQSVMALAAPQAIFLHCLPAHRGEEVAAEVLDGPQSRVFEEAENRLHAQKAVLLYCLLGEGFDP